MKTSEFFGKLKSTYFWGNILAMIIVVAGVCWGTSFAIDIYTHHGESVAIPNIKQKSFADAEHILADAGLSIVVSDTGYVKSLPPDCILEQSPAAGSHVKTGHVIYVIVNASRSPEISLPDIIDNSSLREAMAKLTAMGFKLTQPQFVPGEKDWVVGVAPTTASTSSTTPSKAKTSLMKVAMWTNSTRSEVRASMRRSWNDKTSKREKKKET